MTDPQKTRPRRPAALLTLVVGVAVTGAIAAGPAAAATAPHPVTVRPAATATTAVSALAELSIKPAASTTGYSRDQFGPAWTDNQDAPGGHNGCDTRNDVLRRDLTSLDIDTDGCTVESGHLSDPYVESRSTSPAARAPARPFRSITWLPSATPGRPVRRA